MTANHQMALRVVWETRLDDDTHGPDARELLEMCGLVEPGGRQILPDVTGGIHVPASAKGSSGDVAPPPLRREPGDPPPRHVTTPPGLRVLPPPARTPRRTAPPPPPIKDLEPMTAALQDDTAGDAGPATYIAAIRADEMFVDLDYQRPLDKGRARRMADSFDPTLLGVIDVSDRGPAHRPRYAVVNGQHRRAALVLAHPERDRAPMVCTVHRGLTPVDEARLFHELDVSTTNLTSWDRWHARRGAGDPHVVQIERILADLELKAQPGQTDGNVGCVGALEKLLQLGGPDLLTSTLSVLIAAYGRDWNAYYAPLVSGVGQLLHHYGTEVEATRLIEALGRSTPQQLKAQAAGLRELMPGSVPRLVAQVLVNRMNQTRGGRKLRDVRDRMPAGAVAPKPAAVA